MTEFHGQVAALLRPFDAQELADKMNVDVVTVYRWRNGTRFPRRKALQGIADATGLPIERLRQAWTADDDTRKAQRGAASAF